jgi:hypothetical protein
MRRVHAPDVAAEVSEVEARVSDEVVVTHNGERLFAYSEKRASIEAARCAIESVLRRHGVRAELRISRWDQEAARWWQVDPPGGDFERRVQETAKWLAENAAERDSGTVETRTLVASAGKFIRVQFEQTMLAWAHKLGLECEMLEHPRVLTTQVAFTVTGPKRKVDEFWRRLVDECWETIRRQQQTMQNPLATPYMGRPPATTES